MSIAEKKLSMVQFVEFLMKNWDLPSWKRCAIRIINQYELWVEIPEWRRYKYD